MVDVDGGKWPSISNRRLLANISIAPIKAVPDADPEELTSFALKESDSEKNEVYNEGQLASPTLSGNIC